MTKSDTLVADEAKERLAATLHRYCAAIALSAIAIILLAMLRPLYGKAAPPLELLTLAVAAAAWLGGLGPGLVATVLATVATWYVFIPQHLSFVLESRGDAVRLGLTVGAGITISFLAERVRRAVSQQGQAIVRLTAEIQQRCRAETRLTQQTAVLEAINHIFQESFHSQTEQDLGRSCLAITEKITASKFGFIGEINATTGLLDNIAISDPGWEKCQVDSNGQLRPPTHFEIHGIYGRVLTDGKALFTNDPAAQPDHIAGPAGHPPLTAFLGVPLVREGRTIGMVAVGNRDGGYSQDELRTIETLAPAIVEAFSRKRAEEDLRRLNEELDARVRARTVELEAANKELEAFCYSVSHDLRTPLRGIDGFSQALLEFYGGKFDARGQDWLDRIRAGCQRMGQLIDDLLNLSRLTRTPMQCQSVDLSAMANEIESELREAEPHRSVQFHITEGLRAVGDPRLLRPALQNLLGNAWKFTAKQPQAVIELGRTAVPPDQGRQDLPRAAYFVRDNGVGFDMSYADKLFGPFQRLHAVKDFPGTGIGLALVRRILGRHRGRIWAEAAVNQGATFYFTLNEKKRG